MGTYNGVSSTSMQPDRAITRQEAIAVVARALQLDLDDYAKTDLSKFADAKEVSGWALPYMKAMVAAGYVHGRTQGLAPQANITRAEFAQLYFPCLSAEAALKKLRKWIAVNPELHRQLYGGREGKNDQTFSKRQVQLLIDFLEAP